jgi:hypothetical protein
MPSFQVEGWHAPLAVGPGNPGLLHRPGRSDRQRRWCQNLGPGRQIVPKTTRAASAESEVRQGPRPPTLPARQVKDRQAGPEALHPSSLPIEAAVDAGPRATATKGQWPVDGHLRLTPETASDGTLPGTHPVGDLGVVATVVATGEFQIRPWVPGSG